VRVERVETGAFAVLLPYYFLALSSILRDMTALTGISRDHKMLHGQRSSTVCPIVVQEDL
jgi:hypothetical protein